MKVEVVVARRLSDTISSMEYPSYQATAAWLRFATSCFRLGRGNLSKQMIEDGEMENSRAVRALTHSTGSGYV